MSCVHPIPAIDLGQKLNESGQLVRNIKLLDMKHKYRGFGLEELKERFGDQLLLLPCGHCYSCGVNYSRMWSSRIMLEAGLHQANCFITLTYDQFNCPEHLSKYHFQLFMKRLRKVVGKVRFFACGELGEQSGRPHYHAILFGYDFPDKVILQRSKSGLFIYRSPLLETLWPFGISSIGSVSPESAQYVAKYSLKKKITGEDQGEFVLMSRRPGIGAGAYKESIWDTDRLYLEGRTYKPPRYFDKLAERDNCFVQAIAKDKRIQRAKARVSTKWLYNLNREEEALIKENDDRIMNDVRKVRL